MIAPPHWSEPHQTPEFDEFTIIMRGKNSLKLMGISSFRSWTKSILIQKGQRIRYSNPFEEECEYLAICLPVFLWIFEYEWREGIEYSKLRLIEKRNNFEKSFLLIKIKIHKKLILLIA